ncbi:MAG: hydrolase 1, exosortase A system-associated [Proteobacteria bacterium]|nr:hydrolase 1, exosortase A system-associated [Pseudomonadota bacterium]
MNPQERTVQIDGQGFEMLGILSLPGVDTPRRSTAVVIVVGGAQYRVGSHRQFVLLARRLAAAGYPVLRFDLPGMGDSPGEAPSFEDTAPHLAAAVDVVARSADTRSVVLWGLCDGASASLLYLQAGQDPRVAGVALLNPWVRSKAGLARTHVKHYYRQRLLQREFWRKLAGGGVGWAAVRGLWTNLRAMRRTALAPLSFQERMAFGYQAFEGKILLILSQRDLTAQEFIEQASTHPWWQGALERPAVTRHDLVDADHTCSQPGQQQQLEDLTLAWLAGVDQASQQAISA